MKVIYGNNEEFNIDFETGVGLGNFDGLHVGHMALVNTLVNESRLNRYKSLLYTFTKHPEHVLNPGNRTPLITNTEKKIQLLNESPLDYLYLEEFNEVYSRTEPEDFIKNILVGKLNARLVVAGYDYKFGHKGKGDVKTLVEYGKKYNLKVIIISPIKVDNIIVSSTKIREYISKGDMEKVFKLLGRHYSITGEVQTGRQMGGKIGCPTANLHPESGLALPQKGVYITKTLLDGDFYPSITNVGKNPTFGNNSDIKVETHIINFDRNIYNRNLEVFFLERLRGEKRYKSPAELTRQIYSDIEAAKKYFGI